MANILEELRDALTNHVQGEADKGKSVEHLNGVDGDVAAIKAALTDIQGSAAGAELRPSTDAIAEAVAALEAKHAALRSNVTGEPSTAPSVYTPPEQIDNDNPRPAAATATS